MIYHSIEFLMLGFLFWLITTTSVPPGYFNIWDRGFGKHFKAPI